MTVIEKIEHRQRERNAKIKRQQEIKVYKEEKIEEPPKTIYDLPKLKYYQLSKERVQ